MNKILLAIFAVIVTLPSYAAEDSIDARLKPVGSATVESEPTAASAQIKNVLAAAEVQGSGAGDAEKIYQTNCALCHSTGVANAPKKGDKDAWEQRIAETNATGEQAILALVQSAIKGKNAMPPKGNCLTCSDEQLRSVIKYMAGFE